MLPKVETEALGLARSNGEQGQMPENMQGKGGDAGRSPSAHARLSLGKAPLRPAKTFAAVARELPRHRPLHAPPGPCLRGTPFGDSSGYRGRGARAEPTTRPRSGGANGAEKPPSIRPERASPRVQTSRRTLPGPAADPSDLGLIPVPRKTASKFMAGGVRRGSSGEHPVCHTSSPNGTRGLCPAGAAPTGTVQVAEAVSRNFAGESSDSVADLRGTQEGRGMPELGWSWRCLCGVAGPGRSRCPARAGAMRGGRRRRPAEGRLRALERQPGVPAPRHSPGQKLPSRLLLRNYPLSSREPAGKGQGGPGASEVLGANRGGQDRRLG